MVAMLGANNREQWLPDKLVVVVESDILRHPSAFHGDGIFCDEPKIAPGDFWQSFLHFNLKYLPSMYFFL